MAWRDVITQTVWDYTGCSDTRGEATGDAIASKLQDMPIPDRVALARELLAGTGLVVAKDVGELPAASVQGSVAVVETWNACRAAMLEGGE